MLKSLYINNYALIDKLELDFNSGLNVITGETGAGKSILIGALGLILGNRADKAVVNSKINKKCIIEGVFNNISESVANLLREHDFDIDDELNIRREITFSGKSRAFVNDTPASLQQLKAFASLLIDVNSQNQTYIFKKSENQLAILDDLAETSEELDSYSKSFSEWKQAKKSLQELLQREEEAQKQYDFIKFQFEELEEAGLQKGEEEGIRADLLWMDNAETIKQAVHNSSQLLSENDNNIVANLGLTLAELQPLQAIHEKYSTLFDRLNSSLIEIQDIANECEQLNESADFEPEKHSILQERLDLILSLQQKHRMQSVSELVDYKNELDNQLLDYANMSDQIAEIREVSDKLEKIVEQKANMLSEKRIKSIPEITKKIISSLKNLGMKNSDFEVNISKLTNYGQTGIDMVDFLFSSNKGHAVESISKVASGGELSRLVLSLKSLLSSNRSLPTVVFDEIDTGVSGDIASKVGVVMQQMSQTMQLITITHLPQIAAKGDFHYKVFKKDVDNVTFSGIKLLDKKERKKELALMLSGNSESKSALKMAMELMEK